MVRFFFLGSLLLILGGNIFSQNKIKDIVDIKVSSISDTIKKNNYTIFVNLNIEEGWHINSNKPLDNYLTPTSVKLKNSLSARILSVEYPQEIISKLMFSDSDLSLYEGNVSIKINIESKEKSVEFELQYQSCNNQTCLFPVQKTLIVPLYKEN